MQIEILVETTSVVFVLLIFEELNFFHTPPQGAGFHYHRITKQCLANPVQNKKKQKQVRAKIANQQQPITKAI
jgi:hypothetical protein